jgi:hypothetical protein
MQIAERIAALGHVRLGDAVKEKALQSRPSRHSGLAVAKSTPPAADGCRAIEAGVCKWVFGQERTDGLRRGSRKVGLVRVPRRRPIRMGDRTKCHQRVFVLPEETRMLLAQRLRNRAQIDRRVLECNLAHAFWLPR